MDQVIRTLRWELVPGCLRRFLWLLMALGLMAPICAPAADEGLEYQVKAAFLLNFTKFIEWPASAFDTSDSPIVICILGGDPFGNTLDQIVAGEVVDGRKITIQRIKRLPPLKACQVLFVGRLEKEVLKSLPEVGPGVLTIGEGEKFVHDGGMIAFVVENRRVRFGINETAATSAGLKLSSKLLNVAKSVEK
jgi:hypothetical protein